MDTLLSKLREACIEDAAAKSRVWRQVTPYLRTAKVLEEAKNALPLQGAKEQVWERFLHRIASFEVIESLFARIRHMLMPGVELRVRLREQVLLRLSPLRFSLQPARIVKWSFAFALLLFMVRGGASSFLVSKTTMESHVLLLPTRGEVSIAYGDLWEPLTDEVVVREGVRVRSHEGEATIVLNDDGVIRLEPFTTIDLLDISDRPNAPLAPETVVLYTGKIWVQGLLPSHLPGIDVKTSFGEVTVHEGGVSIAEDSVVDVEVWDHRAVVQHDGHAMALVSGERTQLWDGNIPLVKKISSDAAGALWVSQNLARDAAHRREIAKLQHERRAALAGILPISPLYGVKRAVEDIDTFLTFGEEARAGKQLALAGRRLNEAAALIAVGSERASEPLEEYRDTVLEVGSGPGDGSNVPSLVRRELFESSATFAAALPEDESYPLKRVVVEASTALPDGLIDTGPMEGVLMVDLLGALKQATAQGDTDRLEGIALELNLPFDSLEAKLSDLPPDLQREVRILLGDLALSLVHQGSDVAPVLLETFASYLPLPSEPEVLPLTAEEIANIVQSIMDRVLNTYTMRRSRENQILTEIAAVRLHPDEGRILRRLYQELPPWYAGYVREEMKRLRSDVGA